MTRSFSRPHRKTGVRAPRDVTSAGSSPTEPQQPLPAVDRRLAPEPLLGARPPGTPRAKHPRGVGRELLERSGQRGRVTRIDDDSGAALVG